MPDDHSPAEATIPITGRQLTLAPGPIFSVRRAVESDYEIGEFRAWAGYKNLGSDEATGRLLHFQHVLSFADTKSAGRTGVHAHLAHAHIIIPTSGRGMFSYDGVVTEAMPGTVIIQHGGTIHDQFQFTYAASTAAENRLTPLAIESPACDAQPLSFGFLELFVPRVFANVEIVPPGQVTPADQASAWDHPYHAPGAGFALQPQDAPEAAYRPVAGRPDLEARDAHTWGPTGKLVATWLIRPATVPASSPAIELALAGETGGIDVVFLVAGSARFSRDGGDDVLLETGDTITASQGALGPPLDASPDMRLLRFFIAARAQNLRDRTPDEICRIEALGPRIITHRVVRSAGDNRPVNFLHSGS